MKYKVEKIFFKEKILNDDTDKLAVIRGSETNIARIFDNKDLEKILNDFAKQGWDLIHIESKEDKESKIIATETRSLTEDDISYYKTYKGFNKLPSKYDINVYKSIYKRYFLCFFKKK